MPEPYSLAQHAWLPVALSNGRRVFVRPADITKQVDGHDILRLATGRPDCDISLTEFLIGVLAVTLPPKDTEAWVERYRNPPTEAELQAAFAPIEPALLLDGNGPRFFQDLVPLEGAATPVEALFMDTPAEHFQVEGRTVALSRIGAAIALLTLQTSAPAGGAGHRTSLRGGGPLTTLVVPGIATHAEPTLWQRLWANVPPDFGANEVDLGKVFPWLMPTRLSDKSGKPTMPIDVHPAHAFFGMPRRIRLTMEANGERRTCDLTGLVDDQIVTAYVTRPWGTNYTAWSQGHPLSPYYKPKAADVEWLPLHVQASRVGYRQWLGMVMEAQNGLRVPALCLRAFAERAESLGEKNPEAITGARLLVAGYAMDNMKPLDFAEALLPLVLTPYENVNAAIRERAQAWVMAADAVANQLVSAVKIALYGERAKQDRDSTPLESVKSAFWADTEDDFYTKLRATAAKIEAYRDDRDKQPELAFEAGVAWLASLRAHAFRIFDATVPIEDADGDRIEDIIKGRRMLGLMLTGYGTAGGELFRLLAQPEPEPAAKRKKGRKVA